MSTTVPDRPKDVPATLDLTERQREVLALMMQGKSNKAICRALNLAEQTVKYHVAGILKALNVTSRTEAVIAVSALGWKFPKIAGAARGPETAQVKPPALALAGNNTIPAPASTPDVISNHAQVQDSALAIPDKPSIVVLPFTNLSGDPSQAYFADGIVEEITTALGRLPWLFVIGSRSAFVFKNQIVDLRQVGSALGVRYVLTGSVRKDGNRVRIMAQVNDASLGRQIRADRFDDDLEGIFEMQDRVASSVSATISPALHDAEIERSRRKPTENLTAYDLFLRALPAHQSTFAQSEEALRLLHKAIELDSSFSSAYGLAGWCHYQ